jgi:hypothetical protein
MSAVEDERLEAAAKAAGVLTIDCDGLCLVTAPWVPPRRCLRCGYAARGRWHQYGTRRLHAFHAECLRAARRELGKLELAG